MVHTKNEILQPNNDLSHLLPSLPLGVYRKSLCELCLKFLISNFNATRGSIFLSQKKSICVPHNNDLNMFISSWIHEYVVIIADFLITQKVHQICFFYITIDCASHSSSRVSINMSNQRFRSADKHNRPSNCCSWPYNIGSCNPLSQKSQSWWIACEV